MFSVKRNQIVITALVVMIGIAGYLNYIDAKKLLNNAKEVEDVLLTDDGEVKALVVDSFTGEQVEVIETAKTSIGDAVLQAHNNISLTAEEDYKDAGQAVFVNSTSDSSYFIQAKLDREQSRAKQKDVLLELINNEQVAREQKSESAEQMLTIQQRIEKETAAEALIEAKGFSQAFVRIDDETVDVVVSKSVLSDAELAQIEDIVVRKTGYPIAQIRIQSFKQ